MGTRTRGTLKITRADGSVTHVSKRDADEHARRVLRSEWRPTTALDYKQAGQD